MDKSTISKIIKMQQVVSDDYRDFINLTAKAWEKHEQLKVHLRTLSVLYDVFDLSLNEKERERGSKQ